MTKTHRQIIICSAAALLSTLTVGQSYAQTPVVTLDKFDATVVMPNGMAYLFHDKKFSRFDITRGKKAQTSRIDIASDFRKKLPSNIEASFIHPTNKKVYLFKGDKYYRYDFFKKTVDEPRTIGVDGWKGISGKIDAVLSHPTQNAAYFFQGKNYHVYSFSKRKFTDHGVISKDYWQGVPRNLDAAMMHPNGMAYFFKGDQYYRFDFNENRINKQATVGKSGWKGLSLNRDTSADNDIKLKITLTRIHPHQTKDSDNIGDYKIHQNIKYYADYEDKVPIDRKVQVLSKRPVMLYENNAGKTYTRSYGTSLISSGDIYDYGEEGVQLHLNEGQTKTINNSVTFNITPEEAKDRSAEFKIITYMYELDDCGNQWYIPGLFDSPACDQVVLAREKFIKIDIYEVLKYMQDPKKYEAGYFDGPNGYHKYGADGVTLNFKNDSNGALAGKIVFRAQNDDEKHDFWYRLELVK